jgi:hypothetical protein
MRTRVPRCRWTNAWLQLVVGVGVLSAVAGPVAAQAPPVAPPAGVVRRPLFGVVRDSAGVALEGVSVSVPGSNVLSDVRGRFEVFTADFDTVTIAVRRLGFEPLDALLRARGRVWDTIFVQLDVSAQRLAAFAVNEIRTRAALGLRNFEERKARGIGQFVTRSDIAERGAYRLSDVLRTKRGVNVVRGGKVRFVAFTGGRSALCQPDIWLDGVRSVGMEIDELLPNTVEAIELSPYMSTIPIEFQPAGSTTAQCGTIVVWTRIPNGKAR